MKNNENSCEKKVQSQQKKSINIRKKSNKNKPLKVNGKLVSTHFHHFANMRNSYKTQINEAMDFDKWAYIPMKSHKRKKNFRIHTNIDSQKSRQSFTQQLTNLQPQSSGLFQKYLKRKKLKLLEETQTTFYKHQSNYLKLMKQSNFNDYHNESKNNPEQSSMKHFSPQEKISFKPEKQSKFFLISNSLNNKQIKQAKCPYNDHESFSIKKRFSLNEKVLFFHGNIKIKKSSLIMNEKHAKTESILSGQK